MLATSHEGYRDQYEIPQILLEHGADVKCEDCSGCAPIHWAVPLRAYNTLKLFLLYGADTEVMVGHWPRKFNPLLHLACSLDDVTIVSLLLQRFCNVNKLAIFMHSSFTNVLKDDTFFNDMLQAQYGCDDKAQYNRQFTPLEVICLSDEPNQEIIVDLLMEAGARVRPLFLNLDKSVFPSPGLFERLHKLFTQPSPLLLLCRVFIRECVKGKKLEMIHQELPLPNHMKADILLTRFTEPYVNHLVHFEVQKK